MASSLDLSEIRRQILVAIASDDYLVERLVLKGGNALELVHRIGERSSLDIDFSIPDDFSDISMVRDRLRSALTDRFDSIGLAVFDFQLGPKPSTNADPARSRWGGYHAGSS